MGDEPVSSRVGFGTLASTISGRDLLKIVVTHRRKSSSTRPWALPERADIPLLPVEELNWPPQDGSTSSSQASLLSYH
jgi:hypothetical protein